MYIFHVFIIFPGTLSMEETGSGWDQHIATSSSFQIWRWRELAVMCYLQFRHSTSPVSYKMWASLANLCSTTKELECCTFLNDESKTQKYSCIWTYSLIMWKTQKNIYTLLSVDDAFVPLFWPDKILLLISREFESSWRLCTRSPIFCA